MFNLKQRLADLATLQPNKKHIKSLNIFAFEAFAAWFFVALVLGPTIFFFSLSWLILVRTEISGPLICLPVGALLAYFGYRWIFNFDQKYYFEGLLERKVLKALVYVSPFVALIFAGLAIWLVLSS